MDLYASSASPPVTEPLRVLWRHSFSEISVDPMAVKAMFRLAARCHVHQSLSVAGISSRTIKMMPWITLPYLRRTCDARCYKLVGTARSGVGMRSKVLELGIFFPRKILVPAKPMRGDDLLKVMF